ncbi:lipase precursor [Pseudozyma hubeiensis SY62]|uniref:Lipase n=1 Tax=Pseudozyma hubeiensis (strain SY62) TaxID=1305764 RepID=R9NZ15_PSEHS|nr:lipase precursor [Pseudozyma hubeiensis SY62]GAC93902.1 lipase precursor [Pseudozyma hubeiensis SY62]
MHTRETLPDPNDDPFYAQPSNIASYANGQVIQSRKVDTEIGSINNVNTFQVKYRTTNTQNQAQSNLATVWIPSKPASPPKIFSYQVYMDATQIDCAPSYSYVTGLDKPGKGTVILDTPIVISWALQQGYYVVSSDDEGPRAAFIAGYEEGKAVLDGIRALQNYANLPKDSPIGMYGYSGGAHTTGWAVNLAGSYASELNIIGAAYGGLPASAKDTFTFLNGKSIFSGFALAGVSGLALGHPDMEAFIKPRLNAKGNQTLAQIRSRGECIGQVALGYPFLDVFSLVNDTNLLNEEPIVSILKTETLVQAEASYTVPVPKFPRFMWHALPDEIVPFQPAQDYVTEQCAKGADINWNVYPIAEHISAELLGLLPGIDWLSKAYKGQAPKVACGGGVPATPPPAEDVLGGDLASQFRSLNGKQSAYGKPFNAGF